MHHGKTWIDNTESGKSDLSLCIKEVLSTVDLSTAEALRLRGRMQFASGQLFRRLSRTALFGLTKPTGLVNQKFPEIFKVHFHGMTDF